MSRFEVDILCDGDGGKIHGLRRLEHFTFRQDEDTLMWRWAWDALLKMGGVEGARLDREVGLFEVTPTQTDFLTRRQTVTESEDGRRDVWLHCKRGHVDVRLPWDALVDIWLEPARIEARSLLRASDVDREWKNGRAASAWRRRHES